MSLFHGLSAFPITPTDAQGRIIKDELEMLLERLATAQVNSIGLLGSTGGYAYLSTGERNRAVSTAVDHINGRVPIIASVGALRTDEAVGLAQVAEKAGADGLLLAPVSYTPLTDDEVYQHFLAVACATSLPLCIYNNPSTTHFTFSIELLQRLAQVETIAAVKMPLPPQMAFSTELATLRKALALDFSIGYSGDWGCAAALLAGADGWFSVIGGLLPGPSMQLTKAAQEGDQKEVDRINGLFQPLWNLFQEFGSLRVVYAAANLLQLTSAQPHLPVQALKPEDVERVKLAVEALDI
ncbi:MAG: dihydrodipicolinate synthase family protein [Rhizobiaceae bacterium]